MIDSVIVSLRLRLLLWLLIPLALYIVISAIFTYRSAQQTAELIQDRALLTSAQVIAGDISWEDGMPRAVVDPAALELFATPEQDQVYYQVITKEGQLLIGRPDFPVQINFSQNTPKFSTLEYDQKTIRTVSLVRTLYNSGVLLHVAIQVGQTTRSHDVMVDALWRPSLHRQIAMLILAIALVVLGLTMELRPLMRLKDQLATRDPMSLTPIKAGDLQRELRPIVEAINLYIQRINTQVAAQKRFIADAAHQLRTPLTIINSQIQFAQHAVDKNQKVNVVKLNEVLRALQTSSHHMGDLTNKLLLLSQAEAANSTAFLRHPVDLVAVITAVLEEIFDLALRKHIDLGMEAKIEHAWVVGNETLFAAMMMNLIDNAIRYTSAHGKVTVRIEMNGDHVDINVIDNGQGISAEARQLVFERFYRNAGPDQEGTGLGLAIVKEIVCAAQGTVTLAPRSKGNGLIVKVQLPNCEAK